MAALSLDTGGHPETCRRHREFMAPRFGFTDELRVGFTSRGGVLGRARGLPRPGEPPFSAADVAEVDGFRESVVTAVQRSLFGSRIGSRPGRPGRARGRPRGTGGAGRGPGRTRARHQTPAASAAVEQLGGLDHGSLPAALLHVVVTVRTHGAPSRPHPGTRRPVGRAAGRPLGGGPDGDVVVTVEATRTPR